MLRLSMRISPNRNPIEPDIQPSRYNYAPFTEETISIPVDILSKKSRRNLQKQSRNQK